MSEEYFSTEKRILMAMRKTLGGIIRDLTPSDAATRYPLSDATVEDVKKCFDLIAARERELAQIAGVREERPHFTDEVSAPKVVSIAGLKKKD
jgi:hypothetical protein